MKTLLALFLSGSLVAQVVSFPTGCSRADSSTFTLGFTNGPPIASVGGTEVFTLTPIGSMEATGLIIGDEMTATSTPLGPIWPDMAGCTLGTSPDIVLCATGGVFTINFPAGFPIGDLLIQGLVLDNRPSGFSPSTNGLEYILN